MLFHLLLNSFLVFCILSLSIEVVLRIFGIRNGRICTLCRALPFFKIPFDALVYGIYGESVFLNLNPISCDVYFDTLISKFISIHHATELTASQHLIIPQYLAMRIPPVLLQGSIFCIIGISVLMIAYKMVQFFISKRMLQSIMRCATPCARQISNAQLRAAVEKSQTTILMSPEIDIPFAANKQIIVFAENLSTELSQEEFEAVVAHELEHLRWKDPILKGLCEGISAFFWWIPTGWTLRRLEADQERASDASIQRYGIDSHALAEAIIKVIKKVRIARSTPVTVCHFASSAHSNLDRLKEITSDERSFQTIFNLRCVVGGVCCLLFFISFWMC